MARIISEISAAMRPMAKELIKGGIVAIDAFSEFVAETGEQIKDLVAEARAELAKSQDEEKISRDEPSQSNGTTP
jgi:hypothetical protein